jgi:hypothetical protein
MAIHTEPLIPWWQNAPAGGCTAYMPKVAAPRLHYYVQVINAGARRRIVQILWDNTRFR